jgi:hypothetical protein
MTNCAELIPLEKVFVAEGLRKVMFSAQILPESKRIASQGKL